MSTIGLRRRYCHRPRDIRPSSDRKPVSWQGLARRVGGGPRASWRRSDREPEQRSQTRLAVAGAARGRAWPAEQAEDRGPAGGGAIASPSSGRKPG
ncbi:hypothetical protein ABB37_01647 [Leptomonas pyrrhocoris]|uniref:Uncharacterized protein n=1 Tax=Leptomonas pyrrhocoris TaxID=157538 RepID=A0A0N0VHF5_LEPPY|nr:hypothetical protein ABB37_01647 [Leptomonas pyrrhocoris]XP_015663753.1 hypothetical protein ABB37_01647 [Leptomonas pyrrhocoris]KPA85313.1 hypothetical protein ABB37_01647 [Leptomonas pyrrhocoris]KPA85314.1 hypothetical protein ABB37_01647 [Leptomonas pyrrhocoris]|eukprot:XP_015663752.1 hypothetical protein ABB37_01647 [Leptomonas pyrrhocoris]